MVRWGLTAALVVAAMLAVPGLALAGEPPNQNDPCSKEGRNTCGTLGVGSYEMYRYGVRWFGSYAGLVPGVARTYCIDLRYWYPSPTYRFREETSGTLTNRDGKVVSVEARRRMAYAVWAAGRTSERVQAAAVMLYVHGLMGDAAPGEAAPDAIGPEVAARVARIARNAERFHGPYRIQVRLPASLKVAEKVNGTVRVLSATGHALPGLALRFGAGNAADVPAAATTNANGVATFALTPRTAGGLRLSVRTRALASTLPAVYSATTAPAARNGQRVVAPASQIVNETVERQVEKVQLAVETTAAPNRLLVGEAGHDRVVIGGAAADWIATVAVRLYGPFRSEAEIRCDGKPAWEGSLTTKGPGTYKTSAVAARAAGWYTYVLEVPGDAAHVGLTTPCAVPAESLRVETQPRVTTVVGSPVVERGASITDTIEVSGLGGESATVRAALYGPFPSRELIVCNGTPFWTGEVGVTGDGRFVTAPVRLDAPGYYTYRESVVAAGFVRATQTACGDTTETAVVPGTPVLTTRVSDQQTAPGSTITDTIVVSGLGALHATISAELYGPFPTMAAIRCDGTRAWRATLVATGDGSYRTAPFRIERAGYYTYHESIAESPATGSATTRCAETAETSLAQARPQVTTVASSDVVAPGSLLRDHVRVTGLGKTSASIELDLYGPFGARNAIRCTGTPVWTGRFTVTGDGVHDSPAVRLRKAGFYAYRERLVGTPLVEGTRGECGTVSETSLARPLVITGGRAPTTGVQAADDVGGRTPVHVRIAAVGIDAPLTPSAIDVDAGVLGVPNDIGRPGWWRDGAAPGDRTGAILVAGHVDSASKGAGAFVALHSARRGARVELRTRDGRTHRYKVVSVRLMRKEALPTDIYSLRGRARLVLVTCGGPFDNVSRHYRDNIVVTAVPV